MGGKAAHGAMGRDGVCVVMAAVAAAQEPELPAFEVASLKPQAGSPAYIPSAPDRFTNSQATLHSLIAYGWDVQSFQIEGGTEWGGSRRFDVNAQAPRRVDLPTMRLMVRRLLAERFALRTHVEMRELPIYALVAARREGGRAPGLTPAAVDCAAILAERAGAAPPPGSSAPACNQPSPICRHSSTHSRSSSA